LCKSNEIVTKLIFQTMKCPGAAAQMSMGDSIPQIGTGLAIKNQTRTFKAHQINIEIVMLR
jgi:hypothetical protein